MSCRSGELTNCKQLEEGDRRRSSYRVSAHIILAGGAPADDKKEKGEVIRCDDGMMYVNALKLNLTPVLLLLLVCILILLIVPARAHIQVLYSRPPSHIRLNSF